MNAAVEIDFNSARTVNSRLLEALQQARQERDRAYRELANLQARLDICQSRCERERRMCIALAKALREPRRRRKLVDPRQVDLFD